MVGKKLASLGHGLASLVKGMVNKDHLGMMQSLGQAQFQTPPRRGTWQLLKAYSSHPWLHAAGDKIAAGVSSVQWTASRVVDQDSRSRSGVARTVRPPKTLQFGNHDTRREIQRTMRDSGALEQIEDHPIVDVIMGGNEVHLGVSVSRVSQITLDLVGESFLLKDRSAPLGKPTGLIPLPPTWVQKIPLFPGDTFIIQHNAFRQTVPQEDLLYLRNLDPSDPFYRGVGTAEALTDEVATDEFAATYTKSFFYNSARPDLIITSDGLQPQETQRLEEIWLERHRGFHKFHKPFFMGRKIDIHEIGKSFKDMDLVPLRQFERDTIIQTYGVSPEILGIVESSNRASIQVAEYLFTKYVLVPRLELIRSAYQRWLAPEFDDRIVVDYISPVAQDDEHNLAVATAAPWSMTVNEWRAMAGQDPLSPEEGGDHFMVKIGMETRPSLVSEFNTIDATPLPAETEEDADAGTKQAVSETKDADAGTLSVKKEFTEDDIQTVLLAITTGALSSEVDDVIALTVGWFGEKLIDDVGIDGAFDLLNPSVVDLLQNHSSTQITAINNVTRKRVRRALTIGIKEGESIQKLAERIEAVFSASRGARSKTIARTETVWAANAGTHESMMQHGIKEDSWLTSRDGDVRDAHQKLDGVVTAIDEPFEVDGASAMYPGDFGVAELDINCRCLLKPVVLGKKFNPEGNERASMAVWKDFEADRLPFEEQYRTGLRRGFNTQETAALQALRQA